jgi:hypothetical protein
MKSLTAVSLLANGWRQVLLVFAIVGSLVLVLSLPPFGQDPSYHEFSDGRAFFGVPNFLNVISNLPFLFIGIAGVMVCLKNRPGGVRRAWIVLFMGVALVSVGSSVYHWMPGNATLVWDRLPMTVGFMGLFVALLGEYVSDKLEKLLAPAVLLGVGSVLYWYWSDDLRFYVWIQLIPLLTIPVVTALFRAKYSHQWLLPVALGWYALAKVCEIYDREAFLFTGGVISGHSLKHLLAAIGCLAILWMLIRRKPLHA